MLPIREARYHSSNPMITRVRAKNFRSLADVDVTLGPLTVLVGKNGAGKSAFIDVLRFVRDSFQENLTKALEQRQGFKTLRFSKHFEDTILIHIEMDSKVDSFEGEFEFTLKNGLVDYEKAEIISNENEKSEYCIRKEKMIHSTNVINIDSDYVMTNMRLFLDNSINWSTIWKKMIEFLYSTRIFNVDAESLRDPQVYQTGIWMYDDGRNFAHLLKDIIEVDGGKRKILSSLNHFTSDIDDIRVSNTGGYLVPELKHLDGSWRILKNESDGIVRLLGILVVLNESLVAPGAKGKILVIEEPEMSTYPEYLEVIANLIREASIEKQIIITTQSPDLISCFSAEEIRVVENVDGKTEIGPLSSHQREVLNKKLFTSGDLLRIEGLWRETADA
jgi:predicted ATPase